MLRARTKHMAVKKRLSAACAQDSGLSWFGAPEAKRSRDGRSSSGLVGRNVGTPKDVFPTLLFPASTRGVSTGAVKFTRANSQERGRVCGKEFRRERIQEKN